MPVTAETQEPRQEETLSELLIRLRQRYPAATRAELTDKFFDQVWQNERLARDVVNHWVSLNFNKLTNPGSNIRVVPPSEREQKIEALVPIYKSVMDSVKLDLGNGLIKPIGDCTGLECVAYARARRQHASWIAKIGKQAGERKVREVFTDETLPKGPSLG